MKKEMANLIENFFTEEKRIQRIVNDAVSEKENKIKELQAKNKEYQAKNKEYQEKSETDDKKIEKLRNQLKELNIKPVI